MFSRISSALLLAGLISCAAIPSQAAPLASNPSAPAAKSPGEVIKVHGYHRSCVRGHRHVGHYGRRADCVYGYRSYGYGPSVTLRFGRDYDRRHYHNRYNRFRDNRNSK
jgi:hypothetical protein